MTIKVFIMSQTRFVTERDSRCGCANSAHLKKLGIAIGKLCYLSFMLDMEQRTIACLRDIACAMRLVWILYHKATKVVEKFD